MASSKDPRSLMKAKPTECSAAIHGTLPSDNVASYRRADCYEPSTEAVTVEVDTRLIEYCNTSRLLPLEEFAIKILRLPEDWRNTWSEQLERTTKLPDWKTYEETWYRESQGRLNDLFLQLCNKAIVTMTGGRECTSSLGVYEHDKGLQNSYTKCLLDTADTLWGWSKQAEGMLNGMKVFVGFDKGFKKICWEQIQMFLEIKNTSNGSTFGGHETSQTRSCVTSGSRKHDLDSATVGRISAQGRRKRQRISKSTHTSVSGDSPTDDNNPDHVRLQCAGYALKMLTSGCVRSHAFGMLFDGPNVQLQYYDRSMILKTLVISLFDEDERRLFLAVLYRFTQFTPAEWGIILSGDEKGVAMSAKHKENEKDDPLAGLEFTLEKYGIQKRVRLVRLIFWSQGVIGRGTIVAEAVCICGSSGCECECDWAGPLVVKIGFPATDGAMEYELVSEALNKAVDEHAWVRNHLPRILWAQDISFGGKDTPQEQLAKMFPDHYEKRRACVTVQRKLQPIHDLVTPEEFAQVFYDILQCHRWLYVIPKILHRDISLNNIMFWRNPTTREVYGVLNDFDLSSRVAEDRTASSKQRTGTKPYMAHDLFNNEWDLGHLYRHDLESIFYVLLCLCSRYKGPGEHMDVSKDKPLPYESWFTESYDRVRDSKSSLFLRPSNLITDLITDFFRHFEAWAVGIHKCISRGFAYRQWAGTDNNPFDHHTLGGQFTYATVSAIMSHFDGFQLKTRSTVSLD